MIDNPKPNLETVRNIVEQIAKGLRAFHRLEMLHQDLRPENIMIDSTGTVKIIRRAILPHEILGTPVTKYSLTYGANWISPSTPCVRFNFAQKPLR
ncbi:Serine/threonine protein kinase [methanotrophic endosymbiont of Bathymodiolus azoricus (Menez Gwen)]|nr:Serine/threonine protein kinase [methanotrophic endosymbiont of Bathymodiolus azoricus (Menez Gwen)]